MYEQNECLENYFEQWKGSNMEQVGDVLVLGIKI